MRITDQITNLILDLLEKQGGEVQLQRNDLASRIGCVPSQINYVITSRFTKEQGYIVESRRGGGGFIRIMRLDSPRMCYLMHIVNCIGEEIDEASARILLQNLLYDQKIGKSEAKIMLAAISEQNLRGLADSARRSIRARLLKSMLMNTIE